ncbi:hypothetical protein ACZ90_42725 [Streptomyces albus subsp. albus]|nr:hypothetical protein ACZ90_42725 [Streptomyces albus subsp. albus]
MAAMQLTRTHRILIGVVVTGAVVIAAIGFAGSYAAVRDLAQDKGFGSFSNVFPIGVDAGIVVLLALDLLLTWIRIPFPLLRQTAWLLTAATIAFNGAAAWPDPLGVGMHAVIPVLFVVSVEAARHAVGRIADITADRHMESVRIARWLLAPVPTFRLWRRMKLWELRSYDEVIKIEQDRLVYRARLRARYGRAWRRKAPVESLMPLRLARFGVPLAETAEEGLAAAGIEPPSVRPALPAGSTDAAATAGFLATAPATALAAQAPAASAASVPGTGAPAGPVGVPASPQPLPLSVPLPVYQSSEYQTAEYQGAEYQPAADHDGRSAGGYAPAAAGHPAGAGAPGVPGAAVAQGTAQEAAAGYDAVAVHSTGQDVAQGAAGSPVTVPVGPNRVRDLGGQGVGGAMPYAAQHWQQAEGAPAAGAAGQGAPETADAPHADAAGADPAPEAEGGDPRRPARPRAAVPEDMPLDEICYGAFRAFLADHSRFPSAFQFGRLLRQEYGLTELGDPDVQRHLAECRDRYQAEYTPEA